MSVNSIEYIYTAIDKFSNVAKKINQSIESNQKALSKLNNISKKTADIGKKLTARFTLPVIAAGTASVIAFKKYEEGLTNVGTLIGKKDFEIYKNQLEEASKSAIGMGFSIEDSNQGLFDAISAIGDVSKSLAVYKQSTILAKAGDAELASTIKGMSAVMNAFELDMSQVELVSNSFFSAQKIGVTTVQQLAENVGKVAPVAKQMGVSFQETLVTLAALTKGGLSTEEATTALRAELSALNNPSKEATKVLKRFGVPVGVTEMRTKGLAFTISQLNKAAMKNADALGEAMPNLRAYLSAAALTDEKLKLITDTLDQVNKDFNTGTGMMEGYTMVNESASQAIDEFWGSIKILAVEIGEKLMPSIIKIINFLSIMIDWFMKLDEGKQKFIILSVVILALIPPILVIVGTIGTLISTIGLLPVAITTAIMVAIPLFVMLFNSVKKSFLAIKEIILSFKNFKNEFSKIKNIKTFFEFVWIQLKRIGDMILNLPIIGTMIRAVIGKKEGQYKSKMTSPKMQNIEDITQFVNKSEKENRSEIGGEFNINIKAPKGVVAETESKQKNKNSMLNLGVNLVEAY